MQHHPHLKQQQQQQYHTPVVAEPPSPITLNAMIDTVVLSTLDLLYDILKSVVS